MDARKVKAHAKKNTDRRQSDSEEENESKRNLVHLARGIEMLLCYQSRKELPSVPSGLIAQLAIGNKADSKERREAAEAMTKSRNEKLSLDPKFKRQAWDSETASTAAKRDAKEIEASQEADYDYKVRRQQGKETTQQDTKNEEQNRPVWEDFTHTGDTRGRRNSKGRGTKELRQHTYR